jgi:hypothetical protein
MTTRLAHLYIGPLECAVYRVIFAVSIDIILVDFAGALFEEFALPPLIADMTKDDLRISGGMRML